MINSGNRKESYLGYEQFKLFLRFGEIIYIEYSSGYVFGIRTKFCLVLLTSFVLFPLATPQVLM